jgi:signal transduction histidine kinase
MLARIGRLSLADRLAALYAVAYLGWLVVRTPGTPSSVAIGTLAFLPLGLAVGWANWRNSRLAGVDSRTRAGWLLLSCSALSLWLSGAVWPTYIVLSPRETMPWWIEPLELLQHLCALAGYLCFPNRWPAAGQRGRFFLDIALTVVAGFVLAFHLGVRDLLRTSEPATQFDILRAAVDWLLFVAAAVGFLQKRDATTRTAMGTLLAANTAYLAGNFLLGRSANYLAGDTLDVFYFAAWGLRWAAARTARHGYVRCAQAGDEAGAAAAAGYRRSTFSYLMVASAFMLLLSQILLGDTEDLGLLAVSVGAMVTLLVVRQIQELRENRRLFAAQLEQEARLRQAQKLDAVGKMAGGLAHDFNNVLTAIRGYAELLALDLSKPAVAREDLRHIEEAVDRAAAVTRKLLALSRNQPVQPMVLAPAALVRGLLPLLRQLATDRVEVELATDPATPFVKADPGQLEQALLNLATNARDAMPGGGRLRVSTGSRMTDVPAAGDRAGATARKYAVIRVEDEGEGMTPEVRARVFEPFFTTKANDRGLGLGLAMVKSTIDECGGSVEVQSAPGQGATFTILLPATSEAPAADARSLKGPANPARAARSVLLVDDEASVRTIARRMLDRNGYRVIEAEGGSAAMQLAADSSQPIDLLLTDLVMPGLHGADFIHRFRALRPGVPIVCMTGFAGGQGDAPGIAGDVTVVVSKPFSAEQLLHSVGAALEAL